MIAAIVPCDSCLRSYVGMYETNVKRTWSSNAIAWFVSLFFGGGGVPPVKNGMAEQIHRCRSTRPASCSNRNLAAVYLRVSRKTKPPIPLPRFDFPADLPPKQGGGQNESGGFGRVSSRSWRVTPRLGCSRSF